MMKKSARRGATLESTVDRPVQASLRDAWFWRSLTVGWSPRIMS